MVSSSIVIIPCVFNKFKFRIQSSLMKDIRNRYTSVIIKDLLNKNVFTSLFYLTDFIAINCEQMQFKFCIRNDIAKLITCTYIIDTSLNYN